MKRVTLIAALFFLIQTTAFAEQVQVSAPAAKSSDNQPASVPVNGIAIVVNDEVITKRELEDRVLMIEQRLKAQGVALPPPAELRKQIIERLIVDRAQIQLARETGLRVDDAMLDRAMSRMAEQNKMTLQTFRNQIEREGSSYAQFREGVRDDILMQRIREREVDAKVQISESEVDHYLEAQKADKQQNKNAGGVAQAHVRHIMIKITPAVTKDQATRKLAEFKQRLDNGSAKFDDLAKQFSGDSSAAKGGDLGLLYPGDVPEFDSVIRTLKVGQISDPVETANGMHLIQLLELKMGEISPERQRLLARQAIQSRKLEEASLDWARQLRDRAYVEIR